VATDVVVSVVVVLALIAMIFRVLPDVRLGWRDVFAGALLTGVLFKAGQYLLGLYFRFGSSTSAYGAAGSFVAVLLWVYYSSWILFFGAEFTKAWIGAHGRHIEPDEDSVKVTEGERAQQGMVSQDRLECKARQQAAQPGRDVPGPARRAEPRSSEWEVKEQEWD
jgi:membrane protein